MTRKEYRAIVTTKAYKELAVVAEDHKPRHPQIYVTAILNQAGTLRAPDRAVSYVVADLCRRCTAET